MPEYTEYDIVMNSVQKHPLEVARAVNQLMADRIADEITARRVEIAKALFNGESTDDIESEDMELNDGDETDEIGDGDTEVSDDDLDEFAMDENEVDENNEETEDEDA